LVPKAAHHNHNMNYLIWGNIIILVYNLSLKNSAIFIVFYMSTIAVIEDYKI